MTQRKQYTTAFKLEIVKLMVEQDYTLAQACEVAGADPTAVRRCRQQYLAEQSGKPLPNRRALTPEMQEIQQLKQRIKQLEVEKEILKNGPPGVPRPLCIETPGGTLIWRVDSGRQLLGDTNPVKKPGPGRSADPSVAAPSW